MASDVVDPLVTPMPLDTEMSHTGPIPDDGSPVLFIPAVHEFSLVCEIAPVWVVL